MAHRIEIQNKIGDTRADVRKKKLQSLAFGNKIKSVSLIDVYTIDKPFTKKQLQDICSILTNPVSQESTFESFFSPEKFDYAVEIGFLPGVTDNIGNTAQEEIEDLVKIKFALTENVYSSQITFIEGKITKEEAEVIGQSLANPLIQRVHIKTSKEFIKNKGMGMNVPRVKLNNKISISTVNLNIDDDGLRIIGKQGIVNPDGTRRGPLALDLTYMKTIQKYFKKLKRNPTDIELESLAQTWSEHCKHTIFANPIDDIKNGLYKTYIKEATLQIRKKKDFCVSVFTDNSGAIEFDDKYLVTHKAETHNSPSALDPFGGAITGIVGVNRDAIGFGLGAKPVINIYGFCFGDPKNNNSLYKGPKLTQPLLSTKRIMMGVIDGVNSGGNCSGIPTPQGFVFFDKNYQGKPLVFVGTVGLIPKKVNGKKSYQKKAEPGDCIVMVGGRVGQDGIHGATFSSEALDAGSPATAVQIGDPITQKKLSDAIVKEARDLGLYNSITDNGAGGISCSVAEMAKEAGGFNVELDKVPLKYPGLEPWQIWISESQERMTLAIPKNKWEQFQKLMKKRGVESTVIGKFTKEKKCIVTYKGKTIMNIDMDFLHDGLPVKSLLTTYPPVVFEEPTFKKRKNMTPHFLSMLKRLNIASFEFISAQYDHEVQGGSVLKPLQGKGKINADTSVTKPLLDSEKGVALSQGINPTYSQIDTYHMAACAIDTAIRNLVAAGADLGKIALLDNFCWCSSDEPERLGQLKRAAQACYDYSTFYETPFISGKDSMFNDFKGFDSKGKPVKISIPPTLLISSISVLDDASKTVSIDAKFPDDLIYIIGETHNELGGSEYYSMLESVGNFVPKVNAKKNKKIYTTFSKCIQNNLVSSAISVTRGGLAVALAKKAMAGMFGVDVSLEDILGTVTNNDQALFSESQGRILVTINPKNKDRFESTMSDNPFALIGKVTDKNNVEIKGLTGKTIVKTTVKETLKAYRSTFKDY